MPPATARPAHRVLLAALALLVLLPAAGAQAQATRTWISGVGDDAMACSRIDPCKTIAGAISKTAAGGEINALDPGGYGTVTVGKAITIDLSTAGGRGSILNPLTNGVTVNAGDNDDVILRSISINGSNTSPPPGCSYGGVRGVWLRNARSLKIDDVVIDRQGTGIDIDTQSTITPAVFVERSRLTDICTAGVDGTPGPGKSASVAISSASFFRTGTALLAGDGVTAWIGGSTLTQNTVGLSATGTGTITETAPNQIYGNGTDGSPTARIGAAVAPRDGAPGPAGPAGTPGTPGPAGTPGTPAIRLLLAIGAERFAARAGRSVRVGYAATAPGRATLEVRKGSKLLGSFSGAAKAGRNTLTFGGKIKRKALAPGAYVLRLTVRGADGQVDAESAALRVRR